MLYFPIQGQGYECLKATQEESTVSPARANVLFILKPLPHTTTVLRPFFQDHPGEPVPEENFWTLWCKGRLTEADTVFFIIL